MDCYKMLPFLPCLNVNSPSQIEKETMEKNKKNVDDELIDLFKSSLDLSSDFPFLNDDATINFVRSSKIMIINRGLPGSGKSTLSNKIFKLYGGAERCVICSGDDYFMTSLGEYKFDASKLAEAHICAQNKAIQACRDSISPVIIDNTNVKFWEIKKYLDIAIQHHYIVILVEPKTPHKFDAEKLAALNKHNVPKEIIEKKLKEYQVIYPFYFGWFVDSTESKTIVSLAKTVFDTCLKCEEYQNSLKSKTSTELNKLYDYLNVLHCTAKFLGRRFNNVDDPYLKSSKVAENMGRMHKLEIIGLSMSSRTIAAVVKLDSDKVGLWDNDLTRSELTKLIDNDIYFPMAVDKKKLIDGLKFADRAHLTVGLAKDTLAVQAGIDLVNIKLRMILNDNQTKKKRIHVRETDTFTMYYFEDDFCLAKFKTSIFINTIFGGEY